MQNQQHPLTIAYFTCRQDPKIEWFFYSLNRELKGDWTNINILIIDYLCQYDEHGRTAQFKPFYEKYTKNVRHISPKACPLQGKYKVSRGDYFAASNARNTAFIECKTDYIVCIDDLTVIREGWMDVVRWGQNNGHVILGSYSKVKNLSCAEDGGYIFDHFPPGVDSRYNHQMLKNPFAQQVTGSWLFGCSFGLPLSLALTVDGFDEACDGQGAEDYDFGIRLERVTRNIFYSKQMFTYEDEDLHFAEGNAKFIRESKTLTERTSMKQFIGMESDHAMLQNVLRSNTQPFIPNKLIDIRDRLAKGYNEIADFRERTDWRDGTLMSDM